MTPKKFYQNKLSNLDDLDFKVVNRISEKLLREGSLWGLPEGNLVGFDGPKGLFSYARQKLSQDGNWFLIASLAGAVKLAVEDLDVNSIVGLVCVQGTDWRARDSSATKFGKDWAPMTEGALGTMRAAKSDGVIKPISTSMVTRGMDGTLYEHWVVLPCMPDSVRESGGKAYLDCNGAIYMLDDPQQVKAALSGKATWIIPDASGNFIFPEFC